MFKTRFTELFGIKYPIMQGAMAYLSKAELVSAVSNAGGLGTLAAAGLDTVAELKAEIRKTRSLTDRPFAINFPMLPGRHPISNEQLVATIIEEKVPIVETIAAGRIPENVVRPLKQARVKIIHKCTKVDHAISVQEQGVDAVAILGFGADGHPGLDEIAHFVQIPRALDTLKIPVIMAGAIADARGFVAALALGADGVLMGTRFLMAQECPIHPRIRERLLQAEETETVLVDVSHGFPSRCLINRTALEVLELEKRGASLEEILALRSGARGGKAWVQGDIEGATLPCGQVIGLIDEIMPAKEIIDRIISEAGPIINRLGKYL